MTGCVYVNTKVTPGHDFKLSLANLMQTLTVVLPRSSDSGVIPAFDFPELREQVQLHVHASNPASALAASLRNSCSSRVKGAERQERRTEYSQGRCAQRT